MDSLRRLLYKIIKGCDGSDYNIIQLKKMGADIGEKCRFFTDYKRVSEPWLISIGKETTISTDVLFCTHDNSVIKLDYSDIHDDNSQYGKGYYTDVFGKISVGNNCFIGANSILLYGITISDNVIIGAGSVVTKNIPANQVWAGNPAKHLCDLDDFKRKSLANVFEWDSKSSARAFLSTHPEKLVRR